MTTGEYSSWLETVMELRQHGRLEEALRFCEAMLQQYPDHIDAMGYQAMLLFEMDRPEEALEAYRCLVHAHAARGDFLQALTTAREIKAFAPEVSEELTAQLASQYQEQLGVIPVDQLPTLDFSPFLVEATMPSMSISSSSNDGSEGVEESDEEAMIRRIMELQNQTPEARDTDELDEQIAKEEDSTVVEEPPSLPPLFHHLDAASTAAIWNNLESLRLPPNHRILAQGESGDDFYIIVEGTVVVTHEVEGEEEELGHLGPGQFFGEIALLTPLKRTANVTSVSACRLLRLNRSALETVIQHHPHVHQELIRFVYQRLIHNVLVSSLIFFPLSDIKRWELAQQFSVVEVPSQYPVLAEGTTADGLYLIAGGMVELYRDHPDGTARQIGTLGPGQFFGELSLITQTPSYCTMLTSEATTFLKLSADDFFRVMEQYPRVMDLLKAVAKQRSHELQLMEADFSSKEQGKPATPTA